jgi:hypothetical protein
MCQRELHVEASNKQVKRQLNGHNMSPSMEPKPFCSARSGRNHIVFEGKNWRSDSGSMPPCAHFRSKIVISEATAGACVPPASTMQEANAKLALRTVQKTIVFPTKGGSWSRV